LFLVFYSALKGLREKKQLKRGKNIEKSVEKNWKNFTFVLLALFGYPLALETLGFHFTTFLFLFFLFELKNPKKWLTPLIFAVITVTLSYVILELSLGCQFPRGKFGF
jgi:cytochrome bd-type quinol oxidase subunit 1